MASGYEKGGDEVSYIEWDERARMGAVLGAYAALFIW